MRLQPVSAAVGSALDATQYTADKFVPQSDIVASLHNAGMRP